MAHSNRSTAMVRSNAGLLGEFADLFASLTNLFAGYRPGRHYMRGPGPAWRRKARLGSAGTTGGPEGHETTKAKRRDIKGGRNRVAPRATWSSAEHHPTGKIGL